MTFVHLFESMGFVGILMLICGAIGLVMLVRRIADVRTAMIAPPQLMRTRAIRGGENRPREDGHDFRNFWS